MTHLKRQKLISSTQGRGYKKELYYIHGLELMKLIFAVSDVSLTINLTPCHKTESFLRLYILTTD